MLRTTALETGAEQPLTNDPKVSFRVALGRDCSVQKRLTVHRTLHLEAKVQRI
jgi:hypothetical protein